ncbi:hypothetical protein DFH28DRAFT_983749 [Melampsora americana]|nr:hypothetical protein DFH28DRAFT_983749 [Melampsora americana]
MRMRMRMMMSKLLSFNQTISTFKSIHHPHPTWHFKSSIIKRNHSSSSSSWKRKYQIKLKERFPKTDPIQFTSLTISFLILHELTSILPLISIFTILQSFPNLSQSILNRFNQSEAFLHENITNWFQDGNEKIERMMRKYVGVENKDWKLIFLNGTTSYLIVKALLPIRIGLSLYFSPSLSKMIIKPLTYFKKST